VAHAQQHLGASTVTFGSRLTGLASLHLRPVPLTAAEQQLVRVLEMMLGRPGNGQKHMAEALPE